MSQTIVSGQVILVTGPARSGKSEWAESLAIQSGQQVTYVATALIDTEDAEWQARIAQHQQRRPAHWQTVTAPVDLMAVIQQSRATDCLLIDSLGTWLANLLELEQATWVQLQQQFLETLNQSSATLILVAEETGWGVVPAYPIGRLFRDRLGTLIRHVGQLANQTYLVTGGYVLNLNQLGSRLSSVLSEERV